MPSERVVRLALAALLHNLPALAAEVDPLPAAAERVLRLAQLAAPADRQIVQLAAAYALPLPGAASLPPARPLPSIFHAGAPHANAPVFYPFAALAATSQPTDWLFPVPAPMPHTRGAYLARLFAALDTVAAGIDLDRLDLAYPHLLAWLQRWARCLPAPGGAGSLLDHASLSAAIAACLARYHDDDDAAAIAAEADAPRLRLLAYQLVPAGDALPIRDAPDADTALRRIAGRAFLLAAQAELIGHALAECCGLPLGNLIMASDGTTYLLAPGDSVALAALERCEHTAHRWLHANYTGEVTLAVAHVPLALAQLGAEAGRQPSFAACFDTLQVALECARLQPGCGVLHAADGWNEAAFVVSGERYGEDGACPVCGRLPAAGASAPCRLCAAELAVAQQLTQARYVAYYAGEAPPGSSAGPCGRALRLLAGAAPPDRGRPYLVASLNDPDLGALTDVPASFRYLVDRPAAPRPELAELAGQASGRHLLGYLGLRFSRLAELLPHVAAPGQASAALAIGLSRELGLFYEGWLRALLSQPTQPALIAIGGAQGAPVLIGPWERMAALAIEIRAQLDRFGLHSSAISLAASGLFTAARYPPTQAVAAVGQMIAHTRLQHRPAQPDGARQGDQLALLGDTIDWASLPAILDEVERLHTRAHLLPAALLRSLAEYGQLFRHADTGQPATGLRYRAQFAFNLARTLRAGDDELYRWGNRLIQSLHRPADLTTTRHLSLIATWLLLLRPT